MASFDPPYSGATSRGSAPAERSTHGRYEGSQWGDEAPPWDVAMTAGGCASQPPSQQPHPRPGQVVLWSQVWRKQGFLTFTPGMVSHEERHPWGVGKAWPAPAMHDS
jgi:hypothetical protein